MSVTYGSVTINSIEGLDTGEVAHRAKQTIGKKVAFIDVHTASTDSVLEIGGMLIATSKTTLQTNRTALDALSDGSKHTYADTTDTYYNGDYVIATNSLKWERQISPLAIKFSMRLIEW